MGRATILLLFASLCVAQVPTREEAISFKSAQEAAISPDGSMVAYVESGADWKENEFVTQIWLYREAGGDRIQLTRGNKSANGPRWSPDGKWIAFATGREGKRQVWMIDPRGGEAWQVTDDEGGVGDFDFSPDGKKLAYTSSGPESKADKQRKEKYGEFEVVEKDYKYSHVHLIDLPAEPGVKVKGEALTSGTDYTVGGFAWSPDSTRIAFSAARDADLNSSDTVDLYVVSLADKAVKKIVDTPGPDSNPIWSPDSKRIAFSTANGERYFYYKNSKIGIVPAEGGAVRIIATDFDEQPRISDWGSQGIYFTGMQRTASAVFAADPDTGQWRRILGNDKFSVSRASYTKDFKKAVIGGAAPGDFWELYLTPTERLDPKPITNYGEQFAKYKLAARELIRWKSKDGAEIEGVLLKPADYDPSKKYPLLVVIHGGPTGIDTPYRVPDRNYPVERFAAKGALILRPNYRGSAGYGEKFRSLNVRNLGVGDAWDVVSGIDHLAAKGLIDPERVGTMGWSQGGYISAFLTTAESKRFKAASVGAGISDWMTYYVNTDIHPFTRMYLQATPWDDQQIYAKTSPITYIKNARTPTLIQHGQNDARVPLPNAYELYQGLRDQGTEARLVVYKGFGHGINKPKQQLHVMEENERWFLKHIWGEEMPEPKAPDKDEPNATENKTAN